MSPQTIDEACSRKRKRDATIAELKEAKAISTQVLNLSTRKLYFTVPRGKELKYKDHDALMIRLTYQRAKAALDAIARNNAILGPEFPVILEEPAVPSPKRQRTSPDENSNCLEDRWDCSPPTWAHSNMEVVRPDGGLPPSPLTESPPSWTSPRFTLDSFGSDLQPPPYPPCTPVMEPCSLPEADSLPEAETSKSYTTLKTVSVYQLDYNPSWFSIPCFSDSSYSSFSASLSPLGPSASPASSSFDSSLYASSNLSSNIVTGPELMELLEELGDRSENSTNPECARILDQQMSPTEFADLFLPVEEIDSVLLPNTSVDSTFAPRGSEFYDMEGVE